VCDLETRNTSGLGPIRIDEKKKKAWGNYVVMLMKLFEFKKIEFIAVKF
jgi:hypothetical protein